LAGEKVLIIDDREDSLQFMAEYILKPNGYRYLTARNGETGLQRALSEDPDLIIMDQRMPKMTGLEVLAALKKTQADIPVILMTFHGSEETAVQALRLGAKDYIIKPFETEEMLEAIDRALEERRLRKERDKLNQELTQTNRQLDQRVKELSTVYSVGRSVTALLDPAQVLNRIVEAAVYVTNAEEGTLLLVDKETGDLYLRAARNLGEEFARGFRIKVEDSIAGQVVKTGEPFIESGDEIRLKVKTGYLVKSLLYVPLKVGDQVIGVMSVDNKVSNRPFSDNDMYLLAALADYASIAIVNAQLYSEVKAFNEELEERIKKRTGELRKAQAQLIQSEKLASIGELAAGVAHEINNPLGVILGFSQVILRKLPDDDPLRQPLTSIEREGLRCKKIIQGLLDFSRHTMPTFQPVNLNDVVESACDLFEYQITVNNVKMTKGFAPNLPEIRADANQLQQVFSNLIINAYHAMPKGGDLRITTRAVGDHVQAIFADTGVGIPPENLKRIFDPFFTTKQVGKGTGLGLSVSHGIIESHGGKIEVDSQIDKGTTFVVSLPVKQEGNDSQEG
jgi:two-component system NtrC family sensor kinase